MRSMRRTTRSRVGRGLVVATYDGSDLRIYVNGTLKGTTAASGSIDAYDGSLTIGSGGDGYFDGGLDEVAVFGSALSSTQISAQYSAAGVGCVNIGGATSSTYTVAAADVGSRIRVAVTATNSDGSATAYSTDTLMVSAGMPAPTALPTVSGSAAEGSTLTTTSGSWSNSPSSYGYQWQRCGEYSQTVIGDDPAGYWRLGEASGTTAADSSGFDNAGTYSSVTLGGASGIGTSNGDPDTSAAFNGTSSNVSIASTTSLTPSTAFSVEEWVNPTYGSGSWEGTAIGKVGSDSLSYSQSPDQLLFVIRIGSGYAEVDTSLSPGAWAFIVATYDNSHLRLYVNGTLESTVAASGAINTSTSPVVIGNGTYNYWNGSLDEAAVFNSTLSSTQITAQYNAANVGCVNISGATSASYRVAPADLGSRLRVLVTGTNSDGSSTAASADTAMVGALTYIPTSYRYGLENAAVQGVCPCLGGDPVNSGNGDFSVSATDVTVTSYGPPVSFSRTYDAALAQAQAAAGTPGALGYGWTDNWNMSLAVSRGVLTVTQGDGAQVSVLPAGERCLPGAVCRAGHSGHLLRAAGCDGDA